MEINFSLKKDFILPIISSELRDFLLQSLDPSIKCFDDCEMLFALGSVLKTMVHSSRNKMLDESQPFKGKHMWHLIRMETKQPWGWSMLNLNVLNWNLQWRHEKRQLAALLRQVRLDAGLTQAQVAEAIGETQSYVSKYENGEQRLDLMELEAVCKAVNISLTQFVEHYLES